jgi:hypothetical protein
MAQNKSAVRRTIELTILAVIVICVGLVLLELYNNLFP